jgi:hypothetical protein
LATQRLIQAGVVRFAVKHLYIPKLTIVTHEDPFIFLLDFMQGRFFNWCYPDMLG